MPRRSLLSEAERNSLLVLPESQDDLIQQYSFTDADLALIRQRRGAVNRLGFAVQMCLLRYPGYALASDTALPDPVLHWIAKQVHSDASAWPEYGEREKTRNEHLHELRAYLGLSVRAAGFPQAGAQSGRSRHADGQGHGARRTLP